MRPGKDEGEGDLMSDHLIRAGDVLLSGYLSVCLSVLFVHVEETLFFCAGFAQRGG